MTHRAYKFRIYPSPEQEIVLRKTIGCCRYVYNWALALRKEAWVNAKTSVGYAKSCKALTELKDSPEREWLNEVSSVCLQQSLRNLDESYVNFFKRRGGYPSFKSKRNGGSARFLDNAFRIINNKLFLAKIKTPIEVKWSREISSHPSQCTVSQNAAGQWFASFLCEEEITPLPFSDKKIGIDIGIENFATFSDGTIIQSPKSIRKARRKLARLQRAASRKRLGSKNRAKANRKVARCHQHIVNVRTDFLHKLSTQIVRENQAVAIEDLSVSNMLKNKNLARSISEQGWRQFRTLLDYKCRWYGRELLIVDRYFPSSKTCSCCGATVGLKLSDRKWTCSSCGSEHIRDVNAAKNILAAGQAVSDSGEDGRPTKNYVLRGNSLRKSKVKM